VTSASILSSFVVVVDSRLGAVLPAAALPVLRSAERIYAGPDLPAELVAALGDPAVVPARLPAGPVVLVTGSVTEPAAAELLAAGAELVGTPAPPGVELLAAVAVMDRLRSPGGCPWDAEQTHSSLRQYLIEETYELLEAIEDEDRPALREELGDVLLQVLFHARLAAEYPTEPFTIDQVADGLVGKLVHRHPHVFLTDDPADADLTSLEHRWEELKRVEKRRESSVDGVALGQPAVNLAAKLITRATRSGLPPDLLPAADDQPTGRSLFALVAAVRLAGGEPEGDLRAVARQFAEDVRTAERAAAQAGFDPARLDADTWRKFWPATR
jgi:XTP/dITP diphosphohydrolase